MCGTVCDSLHGWTHCARRACGFGVRPAPCGAMDCAPQAWCRMHAKDTAAARAPAPTAPLAPLYCPRTRSYCLSLRNISNLPFTWVTIVLPASSHVSLSHRSRTLPECPPVSGSKSLAASNASAMLGPRPKGWCCGAPAGGEGYVQRRYRTLNCDWRLVTGPP